MRIRTKKQSKKGLELGWLCKPSSMEGIRSLKLGWVCNPSSMSEEARLELGWVCNPSSKKKSKQARTRVGVQPEFQEEKQAS